MYWLIAVSYTHLDVYKRQVRGYLDQYLLTEAAKALSAFVDELSNWYVRRSRER